jgi:hypothetical protein
MFLGKALASELVVHQDRVGEIGAKKIREHQHQELNSDGLDIVMHIVTCQSPLSSEGTFIVPRGWDWRLLRVAANKGKSVVQISRILLC